MCPRTDRVKRELGRRKRRPAGPSTGRRRICGMPGNDPDAALVQAAKARAAPRDRALRVRVGGQCRYRRDGTPENLIIGSPQGLQPWTRRFS
jgi:hypothetical protein